MTESPPGANDIRGNPPGIPRWVKIASLVGILLIVLLIAVMVIAGGDHGPGRHMSMALTTNHSLEQSGALSAPLVGSGRLG
jgi:hypothetical protein